MAPPLPLMFLLMIPWVYSADDWGVSYTSKYICALKGSSVIMSCTYKYPPEYKIKKVFWTKLIEKGVEPPDLSDDTEYSQRIQYLGDKRQNCTIRLNDVTQKDSHKYYFRFITDKPDGRWIGYPGVTLDITDLHVESPESVTEGDTVSLTCKSTCNLTDRATFIWLKNTQSLTERNNKLLLQSVRREDAGRYSCTVHGHNLTSPHVYLNVRYPPEDPVISISPSGEIIEGDSVTLTCSSDSNPPADISWFKEKTFLTHGQIYSITSIRSDHSGEYKCKSRNEAGEKYSDTVTLNVMYAPKTVSVSMSGSGEIVLGDSVTLTCSSDSNPPVLNYTWFKENESSAVGSGQSYSALQSGFFYCVAQNQHGSQRSAAVSVTVHHRSGWHVVLGITVGCGGLLIIIIIIIIILFKMKKHAGVKNENLSVNQDHIYSDVIERVSVHDAPLSESETADHNDAQYSSITPKRLRGNLTAGKDPESTTEIEYATVQHHKNKKMKRTEEHESQNDRRSDMLTVEEASVIYSSVR
ncbi:B-cell receptor CD22-like [Myxocyprinus asiaticus]|uniref:B-cell receptor CD22-like n=1 Tax=Myxocyprinus asiaticus TaxID=70543 RepID=UPI00222311E5|nr:B-cell receptor CD22-like [Myxocyprinus asiaticus]